MNIVRRNEIELLKIVIHFMLVKQTYIIVYLFVRRHKHVYVLLSSNTV
jgi:hypothetical protein